MGVYAETSGASITCKNKKVAEAIYNILKVQADKSDENGNSFATELDYDDGLVVFHASSGRVQNLEWQLQQIWEAIKDIDGVEELQASFLVEGDGVYFCNE